MGGPGPQAGLDPFHWWGDHDRSHWHTGLSTPPLDVGVHTNCIHVHASSFTRFANSIKELANFL